MKRPKLYTYYRSSCAWRVRIALNITGMDVDMEPIHLVKNGGEQHSEEYKKVNPLEQVPALVVNENLTLTQSVAIMEYIHDMKPSSQLLPDSVEDRAKVRMVTEIVASGIQPLQNAGKKFEDQTEREAWSKGWITKGFRALEEVLSSTSGSCCVGDSLTMADCCLVPQVFKAQRFNVDMSEFPIISRLSQRLCQLQPFIEAHPDNQIDSPARKK